METWRAIPSAPNYEASSQGRIRRATRGKRTRIGMVLRQWKLLGYWVVWLTHDGVQVRHRVHRLICEAFNGAAPEGKSLALHNDGDRGNNVPANLRWGDYYDNNQDTVKHGRWRR